MFEMAYIVPLACGSSTADSTVPGNVTGFQVAPPSALFRRLFPISQTMLSFRASTASCVTENGAVHVVRDGRGVALRDRCDAAERRTRRMRLAQIIDRVREVVPEARLADDIDARRSDVTWDIGERMSLPAERTAMIVMEIRRAGGRSTQSSVHLHATFDEDDKASGVVEFLARNFGEDVGAARTRYAFVGDSGNDRACFAAFHATFAVANVAAHLSRFAVVPRFVATRPMGAGCFASTENRF